MQGCPGQPSSFPGPISPVPVHSRRPWSPTTPLSHLSHVDDPESPIGDPESLIGDSESRIGDSKIPYPQRFEKLSGLRNPYYESFLIAYSYT